MNAKEKFEIGEERRTAKTKFYRVVVLIFDPTTGRAKEFSSLSDRVEVAKACALSKALKYLLDGWELIRVKEEEVEL